MVKPAKIPFQNMQDQVAQVSLNESKVSNDPYQRVLIVTHQALVEKYNITATNEEIIDFLTKHLQTSVEENQFQSMQRMLAVQIAAVEDVVEGRKTPEQAYNEYAEPSGLASRLLPVLKTATKERLEGMKRMFPGDLKDMAVKSTSGYKTTVEMLKLAPLIWPGYLFDYTLEHYRKLCEQYERYRIEYAKENLVGKIPTLMDIDPNILDQGLKKYDRPTRMQEARESRPPAFDHRTYTPGPSEFAPARSDRLGHRQQQ